MPIERVLVPLVEVMILFAVPYVLVKELRLQGPIMSVWRWLKPHLYW